jgi:hypothetical protein
MLLSSIQCLQDQRISRKGRKPASPLTLRRVASNSTSGLSSPLWERKTWYSDPIAMVLFPVAWDRAAAATAELCSNFTGNSVVNLDYRVAPALKEKLETEGLPIRVRDDHRNLRGSRSKKYRDVAKTTGYATVPKRSSFLGRRCREILFAFFF